MPKASVDEYCDADALEHEVWLDLSSSNGHLLSETVPYT